MIGDITFLHDLATHKDNLCKLVINMYIMLTQPDHFIKRSGGTVSIGCATTLCTRRKGLATQDCTLVTTLYMHACYTLTFT